MTNFTFATPSGTTTVILVAVDPPANDLPAPSVPIARPCSIIVASPAPPKPPALNTMSVSGRGRAKRASWPRAPGNR